MRAAANRRHEAALALDIGPSALATTLGFQTPSSAHAILMAAAHGKLPNIHKRKPRKPKADPTAVPALNLVTGAKAVTTPAETGSPQLVGATL
ncbi:hypothetical protein GCM10022197_11650 [Microlunatus spumicola]|uniref:Helix-turn-helix domain-containing protein n=1 Tax=Microlunatus spumicola TaxID=81499 RepID=A0ABP6WXB8_9ACTN